MSTLASSNGALARGSARSTRARVVAEVAAGAAVERRPRRHSAALAGGVGVERRGSPGYGSGVDVARGAGDHRRVVGAQLARRDRAVGTPSAGQPLAQRAVGGDAAADREAVAGRSARARARRAARAPRRSRAGRRRRGRRGARGASLLAEVAHRVEQRGLQPGEREVQARRRCCGDREVERRRVAVRARGARAAGRRGNGRPSRRAPLSNASPAASSSVAPSTSKPSWSSTRARSVWPPLAIRHRNGGSNGSGARKFAATWPWRWSTGASGRPRAAASALAVATPTSSAPTRPGPCGDGDQRRRRRASAPACAQRVVDDGVDQLEVVARGDLGHDAAVAVVDALRGDDVRADLAVARDDRGAGVVAARLDARGSRRGASA